MYVFIAGPITVMTGGAALTWLANPILFISWINLKRDKKLSFYTSLTSTIISLIFLMFKNVISNEAGHYEVVTSYKIGYWLWVTSSSSMLIGNSVINSIYNRL
jgi:hypothetical protein